MQILLQGPLTLKMSTPHPPSSPTAGPSEQLEPAWNPGGRNLSYINKTGRRKFGVIGILLGPVPNLVWTDLRSSYANYEFRFRDMANLSITMEEGID